MGDTTAFHSFALHWQLLCTAGWLKFCVCTLRPLKNFTVNKIEMFNGNID